jgi:hypothetical protein
VCLKIEEAAVVENLPAAASEMEHLTAAFESLEAALKGEGMHEVSSTQG